MSTMCTSFLVFRSPRTVSHMTRAKNNTINNATEAGKDTELRPIRLSTPQQASRTHKTPIGT